MESSQKHETISSSIKDFIKNIRRAWKIYVHPPKEKEVFLDPESLEIKTEKVTEVDTGEQPKQVVYDSVFRTAYVSCMEGGEIGKYEIGSDYKMSRVDTITVPDQCVELLIHGDFIFATTSTFQRDPELRKNQLHVFDRKTNQLLSSTDTGGNWSKVIAVNPIRAEVVVSNWHTHNVSFFDFTNPSAPVLKQVLAWGEAPRGLAYLPSGNELLVTGFYSGNVGLLSAMANGKWENTLSSKKYDYPHYSGNMRDVVVIPSRNLALVSNLGRNSIHFMEVNSLEIKETLLVGREPNSIRLIDDNTLAVSCRGSDCAIFVDINKRAVTARTTTTGRKPTGLDSTNDGLLITSFDGNKLEYHVYK